MPTSFIYKKFSIPEPEKDEEIAKPSFQSQGAGALPLKLTPGAAQIALKAGDDDELGTQQHIDKLTAAALKKGAGSFKRAFEPILKMIEKAKTLEELRNMMEDDDAVAALYGSMDVSDVEELLQKVMLYADLEGRAQENG
ncbi:hypothetical protein SDC9_190469 [bioreactor metagenome]|uniref:Uncharacterized protein n=1 Tax=bioreactor metagenome TaxID=1076179 RepID=A0A645HV28_9ZZZZ